MTNNRLSKDFPTRVLNVISKRSQNLKELHLRGVNWMHLTRDTTCWSFLTRSKQLREFSVDMEHSKATFQKGLSAPSFLRHLPSNIEGISINCLSDSVRTSPCSWDTFRQLTKLKLSDYKNCLNDTMLQSICKNLTKLQILEFGDCENITDFGLTGMVMGQVQSDSQVSLKNLKGLRRLSIEKCGRVTESGLCNSIAFLELVFANLTTSRNRMGLSDSSLIQIAGQNPSLEYLRLGAPQSLCDDYNFNDVMSVNSRLTRISNYRLARNSSLGHPIQHTNEYRASYGVLPYIPHDEKSFPPIRIFHSISKESYGFTAYRFKIQSVPLIAEETSTHLSKESEGKKGRVGSGPTSKGFIIGPRDILVNKGLGKVKMESDFTTVPKVEPENSDNDEADESEGNDDNPPSYIDEGEVIVSDMDKSSDEDLNGSEVEALSSESS